MKTNTATPDSKGYRFAPAIISHAVWLSFRCSLSFRDVEELLAPREILVTSETVRQWCLTSGQTDTNELRRRRPRCGDTGHLDEVFLKINGKQHSLWRAVDQHGTVLDILVQGRRDTKAARRFFRPLLKGLHSVPGVMIPDTRRSSGAAKGEILPGVEHRQHQGLNTRAQHSHQPIGLREREENAQMHISKTDTPLSFCLWSNLRPFATAKALHECSRLPGHCTEPIPDLE